MSRIAVYYFSAGAVAEMVDALDSGSSERSWGFESPRPHHN